LQQVLSLLALLVQEYKYCVTALLKALLKAVLKAVLRLYGEEEAACQQVLSLLALLVQKYLLYWYKNPNAGATLVCYCRAVTYADVC
jgi:hypothetical protein